MGAFDLLAGLTTRLAAALRVDDIADAAGRELGELGFRTVWLAVLDEPTGKLTTLKSILDGVDTLCALPEPRRDDLRQPIGIGFRERRMINISDPSELYILEHDSDRTPPDTLGVPRALHDQLRGRPFAVGPLFAGGGHPVGALGLSSYLGGQPIPDALLTQGPVRVFMDHLGLALARALHLARLEAELAHAREQLASDAPLKTIGELAAAVAHDLNNLSGLALMSVSVGARSPADAFDVLPRIERANRAIGDLVARLQRIARPHTSVAEVADLPQIVEDIAIMIQPILREHSIDVEVDVAAVPPVRCDPVLLHRVLLNLVMNANDALQAVAAGRRIAIRVARAGDAVRLTVADNGPGIAPEVLARLFQPLVTTKRAGHLGLGLAAAHSALEAFGATLEGYNAPTGGAAFEVTLLAAPDAGPDATAADAASAAPHAAPSPHARRGRILAVDDDPDVVDIIRAYLEPCGYEVATATAPAQALAAASAQPFDLVLCDIGLPKQSGLDVCHLLRQAGYRGKLVLMTGWDTQAASFDARVSEYEALLKKPFVGNQLIEVIDSLLCDHATQ